MISLLDQVTPVILALNEEPNIARALHSLTAFRSVLVVDSGSTDGTISIAQSFPNVRIVYRAFDSFAGQWNFVLQSGLIQSPWMLAMDADYIVSEELVRELLREPPGEGVDGFRVSFKYSIHGRLLLSCLYPPVVVLVRVARVRYVQDGHCMRAIVAGAVVNLEGKIVHDDRKPLRRWLSSQSRYADEEFSLLFGKPFSSLRLQDKLRRCVIVMPILVPLYCLTIGLGFLDGRAGLFYAMQRGVAEAALALRILEHSLGGRGR